ncbi:hypothetical protein [Defluviimonas sp. WL0075]|uniref:Uncharacterized protein n=1 Tax=Albidovulum sediminicola TaxID=2984331 RepID=A0ABT2Z0V6_9RHOB|nr:hypothetical protein [Defluviimonas sp. WL0075]MCV2864780.1 hypothetical protein [Defluviimonas sp. WL0075]
MTSMFEITFPATMLVAFDGGTEELLDGKLIGHANGSAKYDLTGPVWGHCTGGFTKAGISTLECENGMKITVDIGPQKPKMSGVNVVSGTALGVAFVSAFGWGNDANEGAVRAAVKSHPASAT